MTDSNFLPNITCPHCGKKIVASISGFGGELSIRGKACSKCGEEYNLVLYATTEVCIPENWDGRIKSYQRSIQHLKKNRQKTVQEVLLKYEEAKRINDEAMQIARDMRNKMKMN